VSVKQNYTLQTTVELTFIPQLPMVGSVSLHCRLFGHA